MGQCSTLPADGENSSKVSSSMNQSKHRPYSNGSNVSSAYGKKQPKEQRDSSYNERLGDDDAYRHPETTDVIMKDGQQQPSENHQRRVQRHGEVDKMVNVVKHGANKFEPYMNDPNEQHPTARRINNRHTPVTSTEEAYPSPPDGAVRMRCYRLNLDAPVVLSPTHDHLGPMPYEPPAHLLPNSPSGGRRSDYTMHSTNDAMMNLQMSKSGDESDKSSTQVAISTARIFRGITVDKNGVILSQNARASRSNRGRDKAKQGEKSRQAAKIDKAKDLVDEARKENDGEKSNMVSLVIVGEYDDMKQLVRDGAKKLRDADGQPDEVLLAVNRPRNSQQNGKYDQYPAPGSASRKRVPSPHTSQTAAQSPARSRSRNGRMQPSIPQTVPPKLKGHPRDRPSNRRMTDTDGVEERSGKQSGEKCNDGLFGVDGESDWGGLSKGFNSIWNCGATGTNGTMSPNNKPLSPGGSKKSSSISTRVRYEGRNETSTRFPRGSSKRDAPGGKDVVIM